jgi:hypothetical protein
MRRLLKIALVAGLPALAVGCEGFLTGGELDQDPNRPAVAEPNQLFLAVQSRGFTFQTGQWARLVCMWMQQCAGTDRQYAAIGVYEVAEGLYEGGFNEVYASGGLNDIRKIKAATAEVNNKVFLGITQVLEGLRIGTAADLWGDIPYSEAALGIGTGGPANPSPKLDEQAAVYAAVQAVLDSAIANITSAQGTTPGAFDIVYSRPCGTVARTAADQRAAWIELARTLKARFYLHTAETNAAAYANALTHALQGISKECNDYVTVHSGQDGEANLWYQFIEEQRSDYISPGAFLVDSILERRAGDTRLEEYVERRVNQTEYHGAEPGEGINNRVALFDPDRIDPAFSQPIVTHVENLLIVAEASYRTGNTTQALDYLNRARATDGLLPVALAGQALLDEILTEKYIQLFQSIEVYNDWKRTCFPNLTPALGASQIPRRFLYPTSERQTNPNVPAPSAQPAANDNDPANAGCRGQR